MNKRNVTLLGTLLALVLFFAVNILANASLRSVRADLTEDRLFTLSEGSREIARNIEEPINLYLYFSKQISSDYPPVRDYAERVLGFLEEYVRASDGKIRLQVIDPEQFSEEEDQAVEQGIQGVPLPTGDTLYFGLAGTNATDDRETIPYFDAFNEEKERFLEYELSKRIWTLAHPDKKKAGILTALPMEGGGGNPMLGQQQQPRWKVLDQLGDFFETEVLDASAEELPKDLDVLVVIHPRGFSDQLLYQIDQWALAGKPLLVFVDPHCEADPGDADPSNPMARFQAERSSNLESLFKAWGFELVKNKVAGDRERGMRMNVPGRDRRQQMETTVVYMLGLGKEDMDAEDPVTSLLQSLIVSASGILRKLSDGTTQFTPLVQTSEAAQELNASEFQFMADPTSMLASFVPGYEKLTLAARVTGEVKSAFPGGPPGQTSSSELLEDPFEAGDADAGADESDQDPKDVPAPSSDPGTPSGTLNLIVVADADLLADRLWVRERPFIGQYVLQELISDNAKLLVNAVENLAGGNELVSIRARGKYSRPFDRVLEIKRDADQRYLAEAQELESKLQSTDQRLRELESARGEGTEELITEEQRKEIEQATAEKLQTRKDLREVKRRLRSDIERLGTSLKWLNIALMPVLVSLAAVLLGAWRIQRRGTK